ncbi:hypothetical protein B0H19DRAFT_1232887 [Mycena capillaripes]|nr:hypothetical protein B0H19DRAFT_1232887 [Mycena capillaripes]
MTGNSTTLFHQRMNILIQWLPQLCGDFIACQVSRGSTITLLINWRTAKCIVIDSVAAPRTLNLRLYSISSFDCLWGPLSNLTAVIDIRSTPSLTCSVALDSLGGGERTANRTTFLSVTQSPIHVATYDCVVEVVETVFPPPPPRTPSLTKPVRKQLPPNAVRNTRTTSRYSLVCVSETTSPPALPQIHFKSVLHCPAYPSATRAGYGLYDIQGSPIGIQWVGDDGMEQVALFLDADLPSYVDVLIRRSPRIQAVACSLHESMREKASPLGVDRP